ncbi:MAG TPA: hypothetical protein PLW48_12030 [Alphaproteobacteria bacterium]|mgnify:FL=1|nr:hypothetical protein [Alphaproteobacteria bacterium]
MRKQLASLTAAFTLAVAGLVAPAAQAQTVPVHPTTTVNSPYYADNYVNQRDINTVAQALGVREAYPLAGRGFSSGILNRTGQHIGLEYTLNGNGYATVIRAYNLDDPAASRQFSLAKGDAIRTENTLAARFNRPARQVYAQPQYRPNAVDVIAAVGLLYIAHEAITNDRHDRHHRHYTPPRRDRHDRYDHRRHR